MCRHLGDHGRTEPPDRAAVPADHTVAARWGCEGYSQHDYLPCQGRAVDYGGDIGCRWGDDSHVTWRQTNSVESVMIIRHDVFSRYAVTSGSKLNRFCR